MPEFGTVAVPGLPSSHSGLSVMMSMMLHLFIMPRPINQVHFTANDNVKMQDTTMRLYPVADGDCVINGDASMPLCPNCCLLHGCQTPGLYGVLVILLVLITDSITFAVGSAWHEAGMLASLQVSIQLSTPYLGSCAWD
ncbi:hypothetical protein V8C42DRAFT_321417 [Trichoderma barbatum]